MTHAADPGPIDLKPNHAPAGDAEAVASGHVYEIKSADSLQLGPAALGDGLEQLHAIVQRWAANPVSAGS